MSDQTNDALLNDLNALPTKGGKKKKKKGAAEKEPIDEKKEDIIPEEPKTNDDLLNDIDSVPQKKKKAKKKKGDAGDNDNAEPAKEEPIKEEPVQEAKKEEPKDEPKEEGEGEEGQEAEEVKPTEKKKVKKVIKKVVKKKGKNDEQAMIIKLLQEKQRKEQELEEKRALEAKEREKQQKEENEKRQKEEEEQRLKEAKEKAIEEERLKHMKELGIKASEIAKLDENKKKTEAMLNQQGTNLDALLESLKTQTHQPRKKKTKAKQADTQNKEDAIDNQDKKNEDEIEDGNDIDINEEEANKKKFVVEGNDDIDDWENEIDDNDTNNNKEEQSKPAQSKDNEITQIESKEDQGKNDEDNSKTKDQKQKSKKKGKQFIDDEPEEKESTDKLRSPIICILGHVDTGKTKILDKLRHSNVQIGEAGGITQQIGATFLPMENYVNHIKKLPEKFQIEPKIPGLLLIDTPGHASFQNLRSRGNSLCDLAVLVINIMKGIEKQTMEALDLIRKRKTPFIIALNQMDRVYQWKSTEWGAFRESLDNQKKSQSKEFWDLIKGNKTQLIKNNLNTEIYDENQSMKEYVNLVPTSAITGEGMPDLIGLLVYLSQKFLAKKIAFKNEVQCTILEVKVLEGTGTTIDIILVNGTLKVGDKIIVGGLFGPIKTTIKIILTPHPMKEMRVKSEYERHESINGAMGAKIFATDLDNALAGSPLYVYTTEQQAEDYAKEITRDFNSIVKDFLSKSGKGIMVQASTLGSLEAILSYLHEQKIAVSIVGVGNLNKKDVLKMQTMYSLQENPLKEDLVILSFDNKIVPEAQQFADANKIKIFNDDIIYHLFDSYIEFKNQCIIERKKAKEKEAIFPCVLKIVMFINKKDPLIIGVDVLEGIMKIGTPLYCSDKKIPIGVIENIEKDHKPVNNVKPVDGSVSIRIKPADSSLTAGRHFEETSSFISHISRNSIDALKEYFREDMSTDDWKLIVKIKKLLEIP